MGFSNFDFNANCHELSFAKPVKGSEEGRCKKKADPLKADAGRAKRREKERNKHECQNMGRCRYKMKDKLK